MITNVKNEQNKRPNAFLTTVLLFLFLFVFFFAVRYGITACRQGQVTNGWIKTEKKSYGDFLSELESLHVEKVTLSQTSSDFLFYLEGDGTAYLTSNPDTDDFKETLLLHGVEVTDVTYSKPFSLLNSAFYSLITAIPISLVLTFLYYRIRRNASAEEKKTEKAKKVAFDNIIGLDEIKSELLFLISLMKKGVDGTDVRLPKGILLEGAPGNGKTMLAEAIATEADVNFLAINAPDFADKYVGETGKSIRKLFDKAEKNAPCILFIDEFDAIGTTRSIHAETAFDKEMNGVLNCFLTQLDGITDRSGVTVIAATNMASSLDPALIRPGRFDKRFLIPNPDATARENLFAHYLRDTEKEKYNYGKLVSLTRGCSCSDVENIVNESRLLALKENKTLPDESDIAIAIRQRYLKGIPKKNILPDREKETFAVHEAGHAIVWYFFAHQRITEISICPTTSGVGGYTQTQPEESGNLAYADELFANVVAALGGRAAETVISGSVEKISLGSNYDIAQATEMAIEYVKFKNGIDYSQFGKFGVTELMKNAQKVLDEANRKAMETVSLYQDKILAVADKLKQTESLSGEEFAEIIL